jgi:hypothetical protein
MEKQNFVYEIQTKKTFELNSIAQKEKLNGKVCVEEREEKICICIRIFGIVNYYNNIILFCNKHNFINNI